MTTHPDEKYLEKTVTYIIEFTYEGEDDINESADQKHGDLCLENNVTGQFSSGGPCYNAYATFSGDEAPAKKAGLKFVEYLRSVGACL